MDDAVHTGQSLPDWVFPPPGGFSADDLALLPGLPPHTELIDGSLVFRRHQSVFHSLATDLLGHGLATSAPGGYVALRRMAIAVNRHNRPEPDFCLLRADGLTPAGDDTCYPASDVLLIGEVVAPDTEARDCYRKPQLYAGAGIPHFWLVHRTLTGRPVVHVYELDRVAGRYVLTGIHHDRLTLTAPCALDIDLTEIEHM
jgi:hypothetical protein